MSNVDSAFHYDSAYTYHIRKSDKVNISVWGHDDLSVGSVYGIYNSNEVYGKWLMVDDRGTIDVPKHGSMSVEGLSIPELKDSLKLIYSKWILNPVVDVKILNKEVSVLGEVRNPGVIKLEKDCMSLLEVISRCGGFEFYANMKHVKIIRQEGPHVRMANINLSQSKDYLMQNIQLHPGDVVIVPSKSYKEFDKRISTIIPFTSTATAVAVLLGVL